MIDLVFFQNPDFALLNYYCLYEDDSLIRVETVESRSECAGNCLSLDDCQFFTIVDEEEGSNTCYLMKTCKKIKSSRKYFTGSIERQVKFSLNLIFKSMALTPLQFTCVLN